MNSNKKAGLKRTGKPNPASFENLVISVIADVAEANRNGMRQYNSKTNPEYSAKLSQLTLTQIHYLQKINSCKTITGSELAREFNVSKPTVSNIIHRLMAKGLINNKASSADKRIRYLSLTKEGALVVAAGRRGYQEYAQKVMNSLTEEETDKLCALFNKLL